MLEKFIFENHLFEKGRPDKRFVGPDFGVYLNANDLRDYEWGYDTINGRISRFYRPITKRKLPLLVVGKTDAEAIAAKNHLMELAEEDIEAKIPGKIYVGDYYTCGFITASQKSSYLINKRICNIDLTLTSDDPAWYKESLHTFLPNTGDYIGVVGGTDYPYDYSYDYAVSLSGQNIVCESVGSSAFKLVIHGNAVNPSVIVGNNVYYINGTVGAGERLVIDGLNKTITLHTASGGKINWFDKRGRNNYIFEPIKPGLHPVSWSGAFGFDFTIIEKRSEPKWT